MLLIRTSSHTCGRWYLPMFLLRDGLLTLINIDSLINLERFCSSLPTMLKLVAPKDKDHITNKSGIIYRFQCERLECDEEYIGETARTFGDRLKEHLKAPSPIYDHSNTTGHNVNINNFSIVGREEQNLSRLIKESMFIRVNDPSLNKKHRQIPSATCMG